MWPCYRPPLWWCSPPLPGNIDWVTFSPKNGITGQPADTPPAAVDRCDELKVVYVGQDLGVYDHIAATHRFLQPCHSGHADTDRRNVAATVAAVLSHTAWRLSLQTHRILHIP